MAGKRPRPAVDSNDNHDRNLNGGSINGNAKVPGSPSSSSNSSYSNEFNPQSYIDRGIKRLRLNSRSNFRFGSIRIENHVSEDQSQPQPQSQQQSNNSNRNYGYNPNSNSNGVLSQAQVPGPVYTPNVNWLLRQLHFERKARLDTFTKSPPEPAYLGGTGTILKGRFVNFPTMQNQVDANSGSISASHSMPMQSTNQSASALQYSMSMPTQPKVVNQQGNSNHVTDDDDYDML